MTDDETRQCPFCKEQIHSEAIKCKHCGSKVGQTKPDHKGICPYCKESIAVDAVICKHCRSNFLIGKDCGCAEVPDSLMAMVSRGLSGGLGGFGGGFGEVALDAGGCVSWCRGSTLWCACKVNIPGYGQGLVIYPCGSCIDDPIVAAARPSVLDLK